MTYDRLLPPNLFASFQLANNCIESATEKRMREKCSPILLRDLLVEVTFEKADRNDKTLDVSGKVRQVDGTQAEVRRFEITAYSFSLSALSFEASKCLAKPRRPKNRCISNTYNTYNCSGIWAILFDIICMYNNHRPGFPWFTIP